MSKSKKPVLRRVFNMTGRIPNGGASTPSHKRIQVGWPKADYSYAIVEFRVYPSNTAVNSSLHGTLTLAKDDSIEPATPNFDNTNELAWSSSYNGITAGLTGPLSIDEVSLNDDENYFDRNIYLHAVDEVGTQDINYFIKLAEFRTKPDVGAIVMLRQYGQLLAQGV